MTHSFSMLFPGQGSQSVGMLSELAEQCPEVKTRFAKASDVLDYDLWELAQAGPEEKLNQTAFTQPVLLSADVAVWDCWQSMGGPSPRFMAGHSLGEYAALVCAGALSFETAVALVADRGQWMQEAVAPGMGAMAAIIGLDDKAVVEICEQASIEGVVSPANYNSIGQVVIAGEMVAVDKAIELAKISGARMAKKIPVSVPSHCKLMQSAANQMKEKLNNVTFTVSTIPVIQNVSAEVFQSADAIRDGLIRQLVSPVLWVQTIQHMMEQGVSQFIECGPGKVLSGLNKRISRDIMTQALHAENNIQDAIQIVSKES